MIGKKSLVFSLLLMFFGTCFAQEFQKVADFTSTKVTQKKFRKARKHFSPELRSSLSTTQLMIGWTVLKKQVGPFQTIEFKDFQKTNEKELYSYIAKFEKASLIIKITVDPEGRVVGLRMTPLDYILPSYAQNMVYGKEKTHVVSDTFKLPAELIIPDKCDQCPVVVLVHGSGASNMDEQGNPNKVFYDLAMGLAKLGVATFRYDKRNYVYKEHYGNKTSQYDLHEETVQDALSAIKALAAFNFLDTNRIFVLGHSLGGYAAPLIAMHSIEVDGVILFAAPSRPLEDVIVEQYTFLLALDGKVGWIDKRIIRSQEKRAAQIKNKNFDTTAKSGELLAYWPGKWWQNVSDYHPVDLLRWLNTRTLVLQGDADYQVTKESDFRIWKEKLKPENSEFILYPGLNHLFIKGVGAKGPGQYTTPGNVSYEVISDIASWVKK
jgi:uncharacterized protein